MKVVYLFTLLILFVFSQAHAVDPFQLLIAQYPEDDYDVARRYCSEIVYDFETQVLDKTGDFAVRFRFNLRNDILFFSCFAKLYPTDKTEFYQETKIHPQKNCQKIAEQIKTRKDVLVVRYSNRVKVNGNKNNCRTYSVFFKQLEN
jgi:hypothetical protein